MTRMTPLLERNEQFASLIRPLGPPTAQVLIVTCLDHRVEAGRSRRVIRDG